MYCGNNKKHPSVVKGEKKIGNKYDCFRKGVGVGLNLPIDESFVEYKPIDKRRIYCGKEKKLPHGYDLIGNNSLCLRKGVGIGKKLKLSRRRKSKKRSRSKSR